jgi:hypothetical protein
MASTYTVGAEITTTTVPTFTLDVASDGKTITITETTGTAGATAWSPGGDAVHTTATESYMRVTTPSGTQYDVDVSASLVPASATGTFNLTMASLGGAATDVFPDGMYIFQYLIKVVTPAVGFVPPTVVNGAALSISEGYVHGLLAKLKPGCTCKSADFETAKLAWMYLKGAAYSAICDKPDKVNDYVNQIAKLTGNITGCISC